MKPSTLTLAATPIALICVNMFCRRLHIKWSATHLPGGKAGRSQFAFTFFTDRMDPASRIETLHTAIMKMPRDKQVALIAEYLEGGKC